MQTQSNEVDPLDLTDFGAKPPIGLTIALLSAFHFLCCGVPLLLLSGASLASLLPSWHVVGPAVILLAAGLTWHVKRRCASCPSSSETARVKASIRATDHEVLSATPSAGAAV